MTRRARLLMHGEGADRKDPLSIAPRETLFLVEEIPNAIQAIDELIVSTLACISRQHDEADQKPVLPRRHVYTPPMRLSHCSGEYA